MSIFATLEYYIGDHFLITPLTTNLIIHLNFTGNFAHTCIISFVIIKAFRFQ